MKRDKILQVATMVVQIVAGAVLCWALYNAVVNMIQ
jgi:hypothetical protein